MKQDPWSALAAGQQVRLGPSILRSLRATASALATLDVYSARGAGAALAYATARQSGAKPPGRPADLIFTARFVSSVCMFAIRFLRPFALTSPLPRSLAIYGALRAIGIEAQVVAGRRIAAARNLPDSYAWVTVGAEAVGELISDRYAYVEVQRWPGARPNGGDPRV